jgi:hypothetical protein
VLELGQAGLVAVWCGRKRGKRRWGLLANPIHRPGVYGSPHTLSEHGPGPYSTLVFPLAAGFFVFSSFCWFCSVFLFGFLFPFLFSFSVFIFLSFYFSVQK